jgi:hypothetical protein
MGYRRSVAEVGYFWCSLGYVPACLGSGRKPSVVLVILGAWLFLGEHLTPVKIVEGRW